LKRFLSVDWDHKQLHLVAAKVGKNGVQLERALLAREEQTPNPAEAEALGRQLRARLKEAGIAPAPVLACIGRDRLVLKEVRFPKVPEAEEPAIVRFQTIKELSESPDEVVIDYAVVASESSNGERRALVLIARKELVGAYQTLCRAAGLKLAGLAPRPFGTLACAERIAAPAAPIAILAIAEGWADFCVGQDDDLLLTRTLSPGQTLGGEIRRTLALYSAQAPQRRAQALYLANGEGGAALRQSLEAALGIPVHVFDPLAGHPGLTAPAGAHGGFAPAVGLLYRYAQAKALPINFVRPKQPRPPRDPNRRWYVGAGAAVAALVLGVIGACLLQLAWRDAEIEKLYVVKSTLESRLGAIEEDAKRIKALDDWTKSSVVWLDELYDLSDLWPETESLRLTQLSADPITHGVKDAHVAKLSLKGVTIADLRPVSKLMDQLEIESFYHLEPKKVSPNTGAERRTFRQQFETHVDITKRPPEKYVRRITSDAFGRDRARSGSNGAPEFGADEGGLP
jgi:Tfp pilus assembly PilM family ATPase